KNLHFSDGFQAGVDVHAGVGAVVEVVAAVQFPVVVFRATAVDAVGHVPVHTDLGFVLPGLVGHSWSERDQLGELAAIQFQLTDLLPGDDTGNVGGLGLDLSHGRAFDGDFGS